MSVKILLPLALLLVFAAGATAQNIVKESDRAMSYGSRPAFTIEFQNADVKLVEARWKEFVKTNFGGKLKKDRKTDEWMAADLKPGAVSDRNYTLYSKVERDGDNVQFTTWFDMGTYFLNRRDNPAKANEAAKILQQFYYDVRRGVIGEGVKTQEARLKEMENRHKKLQRDNAQLRKDVERYKSLIKKAEEDILQNERDQEAALVDMEAQRRAIEDAKRRQDNVENERQ